MSVCDRTCRGCGYAGYTSMWGITCNYILVTGQRRGCPAGAGCSRRRSGHRLMTMDQIIMMPKKAERPPRPTKTPEERAERRKRYVERSREQLRGRQREVIVRYRDEHGLSMRQMADMIGVNVKTLDSWVSERGRANWDKLAPLGIMRPEGL